MDDLLRHANRALGHGEPLAALKLLALRDDATALALRGIALAQLSDFARARQLLRRAQRAFGPRQTLERARCSVALAEIALATRDLKPSSQPLELALRTLEFHGDRHNALHARLIGVRGAIYAGRVADAQAVLAALDLRRAGPLHKAIAALSDAEIAVRALQSARARSALSVARRSAQRANIPALVAEVDQLAVALCEPVARHVQADANRLLKLADVERTLTTRGLFVVDACRRALLCAGARVDFSRRPVLFALLRALAEGWPSVVPRERLIESAFGAARVNASHRVRLRVELARLRKLLARNATIHAQGDGFRLQLRRATTAYVLAPPIEGDDAAVLALLRDGAAWSTSALALALGVSQRTVQRTLAQLGHAGRVRSLGRARSHRWLTAASSEIATHLLLHGRRVPAHIQDGGQDA